MLARHLEPDRYPLAGRVGSAAGEARGTAYHPDHAYRFGTARAGHPPVRPGPADRVRTAQTRWAGRGAGPPTVGR